jgi:hypothetical protein
LRWLVWLPLLSTGELARVMGRDSQTVWGYLKQLRRWNLVGRVLFHECGWPSRHLRYHITDLGLYVLAARYPQPLSVPKLAASYAIERADLLARIARPQVHFVLCDLVSRLLCECPPGYALTSYQQPWEQLYRWQGDTHTFHADAALLLRDTSGNEHAFYVFVDQVERLLSQQQVIKRLQELLTLRMATEMRNEVLPQVLLLTTPARFPFWSGVLEQIAHTRVGSPFSGAIADYEQLSQGVCAPLWLLFRDLLGRKSKVLPLQKAVPLFSLFEQPASPMISEFFSQRGTFDHLLIQSDDRPRARGRQRLARFVGESLQDEAIQLVQRMRDQRSQVATYIREVLYSPKLERLHVTCLLNISLSATQKAVLALLTRHYLLSLTDLVFHVHPESGDTRHMQQQMALLYDLEFVRSFDWREDVPAGTSWHERQRYEMTELGLRYMAMRHGVGPTHYLCPDPPEDASGNKVKQDRRKISPFDTSFRWVQRGVRAQRGAREFKWQLKHANGLYRIIRHVIATGRRTGDYEIVLWKSALESLRYCYDPLDEKPIYAKPDAELLYRLRGSATVENLFVEYDRGTTSKRDYRPKFLTYAAYQRVRHTLLPRIIMITPSTQSAQRIQRNIEQANVPEVQITVVLEQDVLHHGLLPVLGIQTGGQTEIPDVER